MLKKILIAYFSRTGVSKALAKSISEELGADLFSIDPVNPYSSNYVKALVDAKIEQFTNGKPLIRRRVPDIKKYSTIVVIYPIWWHTCPNIIVRFLKENDFADKKIIPICTYTKTGAGNSLNDMSKACPKASFHSVYEATGLKADAVPYLAKEIKLIHKWTNICS